MKRRRRSSAIPVRSTRRRRLVVSAVRNGLSKPKRMHPRYEAGRGRPVDVRLGAEVWRFAGAPGCTSRSKTDPVIARYVIHPETRSAITSGGAVDAGDRMLRVQEVYVLRCRVLVEGRSWRQVARKVGISRYKIRCYLTLAKPVRIERQPRRKQVRKRAPPCLEESLTERSRRTSPKQSLTRRGLHAADAPGGR